MKDLVTIHIHTADCINSMEIPTDISMNLMEVLKGNEYPVEAVCGGMALCATCRIKVLSGGENLLPQGDAELDMLDTLPDTCDKHRLACQISDFNTIDGMHFELDPAE